MTLEKNYFLAEHFKGLMEIKQRKSEEICDLSDKIIGLQIKRLQRGLPLAINFEFIKRDPLEYATFRATQILQYSGPLCEMA